MIFLFLFLIGLCIWLLLRDVPFCWPFADYFGQGVLSFHRLLSVSLLLDHILAELLQLGTQLPLFLLH